MPRKSQHVFFLGPQDVRLRSQPPLPLCFCSSYTRLLVISKVGHQKVVLQKPLVILVSWRVKDPAQLGKQVSTPTGFSCEHI